MIIDHALADLEDSQAQLRKCSQRLLARAVWKAGQAATITYTALTSVAKPKGRATDKAKPKADPTAATPARTTKSVVSTHHCYF